MKFDAFADPWEHLRLLSDGVRNDALVELLRLRAPGARVLEVGCGTGLLACVAARLGAREVHAVEPTRMWVEAARLVRENGLDGVVEVVHGRIEDIAPREVDFAFSELLNADPFSEGVLEAMDAARRWVGPGGTWAPRRMRVWIAPVRAADTAKEARLAIQHVRRIGAQFDLCVGALESALKTPGTYRFVSAVEAPIGPPVLACAIALGARERPENRIVDLGVDEAGPVAGALVWFEAELDDGIVMSNAPGRGGHWGQLVCGWTRERVLEPGEPLPVMVTFEDGEVEVEPVA